MKAPDKIYISKKNLDDNWNQQRCDDIEYIRKDALLEWAKEEIRTIANEKDDYYAGKRVAFQQVIDKLNSL